MEQDIAKALNDFLKRNGETMHEYLLRVNPLYAKLVKTNQKETK